MGKGGGKTEGNGKSDGIWSDDLNILGKGAKYGWGLLIYGYEWVL